MFVKSRRAFFKTSFLTTALVISAADQMFGAVTPLQTLRIVKDDLFPHANTLDSNSFAYFSLVLQHSSISDDSKQFLRNGTKWINEEAVNTYSKVYTHLSAEQRQNILKIISKESWGESWIRAVLKYILEATLGDPIYGVNKGEKGWKWLKFEAGQPRPTGAYL
jgi:hypothetical protein